jgi:hypothetical protein
MQHEHGMFGGIERRVKTVHASRVLAIIHDF